MANSSLSITPLAIALQLIGTNGPSARLLQ
jgi:hypothetical protein